MDFPLLSNLYKFLQYYKKLHVYFLLNYYFKFHNILFTNLYIRLYRKRLLKIEERNTRQLLRISKRNKKFYSAKRTFSYSSVFLLRTDNRTLDKNKRKKKYIYVNKFKDCGNQYNFDPFYPMSTYILNEFNSNRTKRLNFNENKSFNLSYFDKRLNHINFKFFNNYIFSIILDIYNKTNKKEFLYALKNNGLFFYNYLLFMKKRILFFKYLLLELKKKLQCFFSIFDAIMDNNELFLNFLKRKNVPFISDYQKIIQSAIQEQNKYVNYSKLYLKYRSLYNLLLTNLKATNDVFASRYKYKLNKNTHASNVNKYEFLLKNLSKYSYLFNKFGIFKKAFTNLNEEKDLMYVQILKYLTLFKSIVRTNVLSTYRNNNAVIYIKSTITNVFLYFIYNNKLIFKKTCGELNEVRKKERRFWRNIYPLVETLLPFISKIKSIYKFPYVSLYINGSSSLCSPLITRMRKYNKKFRRLIRFLFNELEFFYDKTIELKERFKGAYILYPIYRLKFFSICDGFNRLSKVFFSINKVKDLTSWPYNGCANKKSKVKKKKKKC